MLKKRSFDFSPKKILNKSLIFNINKTKEGQIMDKLQKGYQKITMNFIQNISQAQMFLHLEKKTKKKWKTKKAGS